MMANWPSFGMRRLFAISLFCLLPSVGLFAENVSLPVPRAVIYPGQTISSDNIQLRKFDRAMTDRLPVVRKPEDMSGKVAQQTLLPMRLVPLNGLREPYMVVRGAPTTLVYNTPNLVITAGGLAMDSGGMGDLVQVRNLDTGRTVRGIVTGNGHVQVGTQ